MYSLHVLVGSGDDCAQLMVFTSVTAVVNCPSAPIEVTLNLQAAIRAKNAGIHMIVLGVGGWTDESELLAIASYPPSRNYIRVRNYADLRNFAQRMADYLCNSEYFNIWRRPN